MSDREPPNLRKVQSCWTCKYQYYGIGTELCQKHDGPFAAYWNVCDDYTPESVVERDKNKVCKTCKHRCYCSMTDVMKCRKFGMAVSADYGCDDYEAEVKCGYMEI